MRRLTDNLEGLLSEFWPGWVQRGMLAYPLPKSQKDLGSFVVYLGNVSVHERGKWFRNSRNVGGNVINLFAYGFTHQATHKADSAVIFKRARAFVGLDGAVPETEEERAQRLRNEAKEASRRKAAEEKQAADRARKLETAIGIWDDSIPIAGTHSEAYLLERLGMKPKGGWPDVLRHHPRLPYSSPDGTTKPGTFYPALVCKVTDMHDDLTAVWRIFLHPTKPEKAPVPVAKMGLGTAGGGAIRIGGDAGEIGVAEGVESALGAWLFVDQRYPVWSVMSTSGMTGFEWPVLTDGPIHIFPDGDKEMARADPSSGWKYKQSIPPGRAAAMSLLEKTGGIGILEYEPPPKMDYCDMWRKKLDRIS